MGKITCSVRIDGRLKGDLDRLSECNGRTLGAIVSDEMEHMLRELVDENEGYMRANRRELRAVEIIENFLLTANKTDYPELFASNTGSPSLTLDQSVQFYRNNPDKKEIWWATRMMYSESETFTLDSLAEKRSELNQQYLELLEFFSIADHFESILQPTCLAWTEGGILKEDIRHRLQAKYNDRRSGFQDRYDKIKRRYGFENMDEMWLGKEPVTNRFLNRLRMEFC